MDESVSDVSPRLDFIREKLAELSATPAWTGQVAFCPVSNTTCLIEVQNRFVRDWVRENFLPQVQEGIKNLPGEEVSIQIVVTTSCSLQPATPPVASSPGPTFSRKVASPPHETLKAKYSFDHFVVGSSNQFAHAAGHAVAKIPGTNYNPLFIYGGVGLGKTHLLNAIGLETLKNFPQCRIIYTGAERFMNELIYCLRFQKMAEFRKKYRDSCDVLLIDDVQIIAGKDKTQEEFFHTFNHLHDGQKQIVLTSDQVPRDIPNLEERIRSRFEWGLIADIQVPDLETRMAILKKKADDDSIQLSDEVTLFLATHIKSNIRELEGALIRLNAFASLGHAPITVAFAKDTLKNVLGSVDRPLTVEEVQKMVSDFFNIKLSDLLGKRRVRSLAHPRQIAMYLCRKHVKASFPEIGSKFGGKDHSTVVHAYSKIRRIVETDSSVKEQIGVLERNFCR